MGKCYLFDKKQDVNFLSFSCLCLQRYIFVCIGNFKLDRCNYNIFHCQTKTNLPQDRDKNVLTSLNVIFLPMFLENSTSKILEIF